MNTVKILFLMNSLNFGGAEKHTIKLINNLDRKKFEIYVCYIKNEEHLLHEIDKNGLKIFCFHKKRKFDISVLLKLKNVIKINRPNIIVCVDLYPSIYAHLVRFVYGFKYKLVQIVHCTIMVDLFNRLFAIFLYSKLINFSDSIVFVCRNQMDYWFNFYNTDKKLSQYIYNGVDLNFFENKFSHQEIFKRRSLLGISQYDTVVCICAALRKEKRHVDLLSAAKLLVEKRMPVKVLIVGDGEERKIVENHAIQLGMTENVVITGFVQDVRPYIAISDIFVICSTSETFSIAVLEAMALGKAIVASDIGGASEQIIQGQNGFLFPAGNITALSENLEIIIRNKLAEIMGEKSRLRVCEQFGEAQMVEKYQNYFSKLPQ